MKTLKFFTLLVILAFFPFGNTSAQNQKAVYTWTVTGCFDIDCVGETVCGDCYFTWTNWDNKYQMKVMGTLEGQTSGDLYKFNQVNNESWKAWKEGAAQGYNFVQNVVITKKGGPAIVLRIMDHITVNANGEVTAEFYTYSTSCD